MRMIHGRHGRVLPRYSLYLLLRFSGACASGYTHLYYVVNIIAPRSADCCIYADMELVSPRIAKI